MDASEKKQESKRFGTYLVIAVLLAGWVITLGWFSSSYNSHIRAIQELSADSAALRHQLASQSSDLQEQFVHVSEKVNDFSRYLQNQTALIAHITGELVPLQMPPGWEEELGRLEAIVLDQRVRPRTATAAGTFLQNVRDLIAATPPWAQPYYLERLANLRWAALVFDETNRTLLLAQPISLEHIQEHFDSLIELEAIAPASHDQAVMEHLRHYSERIYSDSGTSLRDASVTKARELLKKEAKQDAPVNDFLSALGWLERLDDDDSEVRDLKVEVTQRLTEIETLRHVDQVRKRYENLKRTAANDPELLEHGTRLLVSDLGAARGRLAFEELQIPSLDTLYKAMEDALLELQSVAFDKEVDRRDQAIIRYQRWALQTITSTESELARAKRSAGDNTLIYGQRWETKEFNIVKKAMLALLEVDARLLDWPLVELYQETMAEGSKILQMNDNGKGVRKQLASESVSVKKKALDSF